MSSQSTSPNVPGAPKIPSLDLNSEKGEPSSPKSPDPAVTQQPEAKEEPKIGAFIPLSEFAKAHESSVDKAATHDSSKRTRGTKQPACSAGWDKYLQGIYVSCAWFLRVLLCLAIGVVVIVAFALCIAVSCASAAANGAIWVLIGNAILHATHHSGYIDSNEVVAIVGAVGGILAVMCLGTVMAIVPRTSINQNTGEAEHSWIVRAPAVVCAGALTGPIGVSILKNHQFDLQGFDTLHAARAGALGATIIGPAMILALPVLALVLGVLLSPLWAAMYLGVQYMIAKAQEPISDGGCCHSCMCVGDDSESEIQEQLERHAKPRNESWV